MQGGKVQYNGQKTKPSRPVSIGAVVKFPQGFDEKTVVINQIKDKRQSAPLAQLMYTETEESSEKRAQNSLSRKIMGQNPRPENRPDKKQRRQLIKLKYRIVAVLMTDNKPRKNLIYYRYLFSEHQVHAELVH